MNNLQFNGHKGQIIQSSPHNNYLVISLTKRIVICGTFSNKWNWTENYDNDSGFQSFITYIGCNENELDKYHKFINRYNGFTDEKYRKSKRNLNYPLEIKVRDLSLQAIDELIKLK